MKNEVIFWVLGLGVAALVIGSMLLKPQKATVGLGAGTVGGSLTGTVNAVSGAVTSLSNLLSGLSGGSGGGNVDPVASTPVDKGGEAYDAISYI